MERAHQKELAQKARKTKANIELSKRTTVDDLTQGIVNYKYLGLDFEKAENERLRYVALFIFLLDDTRLDYFVLERKYSPIYFCLDDRIDVDFVLPSLITKIRAESFPFCSTQTLMKRTMFKSATHHLTQALSKPFRNVSTKATTCRNLFVPCVGLFRKHSSSNQRREYGSIEHRKALLMEVVVRMSLMIMFTIQLLYNPLNCQ
jgi:hypothetical protein